MSTAVIDVTGPSFGTDVVERSHEVPVIVDFWAPWCGPCKTLGPILERMAEQAEGKWILAKVNTDEHKQLATDFRIMGIPNVKAFIGGKVVDEFAGALPEYAIKTWLDKVLPSEADEAFEAARKAEEKGGREEARKTYERLIAEDSENPRLRAALARLDLLDGEIGSAIAHVESVHEAYYQTTDGELERAWVATEAAQVARTLDELHAAVNADPTDMTARYELAIRQANDGNFAPALEQLLQIIMRDRSFRDDIGRIAMIRIFEIMGPQSEEVDEWRAKMGRAMY